MDNNFIDDREIDTEKVLANMTEEERQREFDRLYGEYIKTESLKVRYIADHETVALDRNKIYEVISIENGWYRIKTELDEDYLFPPEAFKVVD